MLDFQIKHAFLISFVVERCSVDFCQPRFLNILSANEIVFLYANNVLLLIKQ